MLYRDLPKLLTGHILSNDEEILAVAISRIFGINPLQPVQFSYTPATDGPSSCRVISLSKIPDSILLPLMSSFDFAKELMKFSKATLGEKARYPDSPNVLGEKGWQIFSCKMDGSVVVVCEATWITKKRLPTRLSLRLKNS